VVIDTSRDFPDMANEGVATLAGLGDLTHIEILLCGGGGSGGGPPNDVGNAGAGGSGSGIERFTVLEPDDKFDSFNITLGTGGIFNLDDGTETMVTGVSSTGFFLDLIGYGGGHGLAATSSPGGNGGAGGGSGGSGSGATPGIAGSLGGLVGAVGGIKNSVTATPGQRGAFKLPWRAGGGGGAPDSVAGGAGASWQGGFLAGANSLAGNTMGGASSAFGRGGSGIAGPGRNGTRCAGGSSIGNGGDGLAVFRYFVL